MHWIPHACGYIAYVLVWQEEGALCVEHLVLFHNYPLFSEAWRLMVGLSGVASHWYSLLLGADCQ